MISEISFSRVHTITQNYNNNDSSNQIDLQEQKDLFQAVFNAFFGKEWVQGIFWYAFEGSSNYAGPMHRDYCIVSIDRPGAGANKPLNIIHINVMPRGR